MSQQNSFNYNSFEDQDNSFIDDYQLFDNEQNLKQLKNKYKVTYKELHKEFIYIPESGLLINKLLNHVEGKLNNQGYLTVHYKDSHYLIHRIAYFMYHGHWPKKQIDHINRIRTDNRIANLRDVSASVNMRNRSNANSNISGLMGITWLKNDMRWKAVIQYNNKQVFIGHFKNFINAVKARYYAEQKFGYLSNGILSPAEKYLKYTEKITFHTNIDFDEKSIPKNETIASEWEFFCYENKKKIDKLAEE